MTGIRRFEEIEAWKNARRLTHQIYRLSRQGAFSRDFGLKDQIQRAAVMSNIAEGFESRTRKLFLNFLRTAKGSAGEVRCQLYVALDQHYITAQQFHEAYRIADKVGLQIFRLMQYLQKPS